MKIYYIQTLGVILFPFALFYVISLLSRLICGPEPTADDWIKYFEAKDKARKSPNTFVCPPW